MSSYVDFSISVKSSQCLDLRDDWVLHCIISDLEAIMNFTVGASGVGNLVKWQINDPVGNIAASSKGEDDCVETGWKSCKSLKIPSCIWKCLYINQWIFAAFGTVPSVDAGNTLVCDWGHIR